MLQQIGEKVEWMLHCGRANQFAGTVMVSP
jgi:hypothetical protein